MQKFFHFLAIALTALTMASCNGNEQDTIFFNIQTLSTRARVTVLCSDNEAFFYSNYIAKDDVQKDGGLQHIAQNVVKNETFDDLYNYHYIHKFKEEYSAVALVPNTVYTLYAFIVDQDEQGYARVAGPVVSRDFTSLPEHTLPAAFSVSATKRVRFADANTNKVLGHYGFFDNQYQYEYASDGNTIDLFQWDNVADITAEQKDFEALTADEWWYLFKERPRADILFAHATVDAVRGLIILPDNWQTPTGLNIITSKAMGMEWDEKELKYAHSSDTFNGYAQNKLTQQQWLLLEYAGAVFLPATNDNDGYGWYWSSSELDNGSEFAHAFVFTPFYLYIRSLNKSAIKKIECCPLRLARPL